MKTKEIKRIITKPAAYDAWFRATYWEIVGKWIAPTAEELNELAELFLRLVHFFRSVDSFSHLPDKTREDTATYSANSTHLLEVD